jgi:hypothetical protein
LADGDRVVVGLRELARAQAHLLLDLLHDPLGLLFVPVDEQPAWALRDMTADDQDGEAERESEPEANPPVQERRQEVQSRYGQQSAQRRAGPVGPVDDDVDPPAQPGWDQLVDCRVDGGVLAADTHAGDEPASEEEPGRE